MQRALALTLGLTVVAGGVLFGVLNAAEEAAPPVRRVEIGPLLMEGIPDIPAEIVDELYQYQQARSARFAGWLPAPQGVLITTRFGETKQVYRVRQPLGAREQLSFFPEPIASVAPSPDPEHPGFLYSKDVGGNELYQIHYHDIRSGRHRQLTDGQGRNTIPIWSNRGDRFAYSTTRRNGRDIDIHVYDLDDNSSTPVLESEGSWRALDWSPDDSKLLVLHYVSANESYPHLLDLETGALTLFRPSSEKVRFGSARFSRDGRGVYYTSDEGTEFRHLRYHDLASGESRLLSGDIPWDVTDFALSADGRYMAFVVNADGLSEMHVRAVYGWRKLPAPKLPIGVVGGLNLSEDGRRVGFHLISPRSPGDVYSFHVAETRLTRWTASEVGGLPTETFIEPTLVRFPSFDLLENGKPRQIPAFYYKPEGAGPHPVLIRLHGGPEAQSRPRFNPTLQYWIRELGIAVIEPNVRGSSGYGKSYLKLDDGYQREDSVKDVGALLDWIAKQPELDARRVGVIGGSYGGYMVLASLIHYGERLRAGVDVVGVSNFVTFLNNTKDYRRQLRREEYGDERDPQMVAFLESIAPTAHADKIKRPLMIAQGANDPRVPRSEADAMVKTIRDNGGEVWYFLARDEGHGFKKKSNRDRYHRAVALFLKSNLLPLPAEPPPPASDITPDAEPQPSPEPEVPPPAAAPEVAPTSETAPAPEAAPAPPASETEAPPASAVDEEAMMPADPEEAELDEDSPDTPLP